jgi:nicotinate-nucleotide pyrophosphorylase (carboxylating)
MLFCPPAKYIIVKQVAEALSEDLLASVDYTANLIPERNMVNASIKTKEEMVVCGINWADAAFLLCDENVHITWKVKDGDKVNAGTVLCDIMGNAKGVLTAERTALNFLQTLSATASITQKYVELVKSTGVKIMDTRKTIPGLRLAQKYAVTVGGGHNQRTGLYDGVLIKENHIAACGGVDKALSKALSITPSHIPIQIEVETFSQFKQAIYYGAKLILLDNMSLEKIARCVEENKNAAELEVSGNIRLNNVLEYAKTGVDRISIGSLTKNIQAIDLSLRVN